MDSRAVGGFYLTLRYHGAKPAACAAWEPYAKGEALEPQSLPLYRRPSFRLAGLLLEERTQLLHRLLTPGSPDRPLLELPIRYSPLILL